LNPAGRSCCTAWGRERRQAGQHAHSSAEISLGHTGERAIAWRHLRVIGLGEEIACEAKRLGMRQRLICQIIFELPDQFRHVQVRGAFA
jgi:hypothetical protein